MLIISIAIALFPAVFLLYHFGMIAFYHPLNKTGDGKIRAACVGDSITYGCTVGNWCKNNYPAVLGNLLGESYCVNNFGYSRRCILPALTPDWH